MAELNPNGNPVRVGDVVIRSPGLAGEASMHMPGSPSVRAATLTTDELETALANESLQEQQTIEVTRTREVESGAASARSTHFGEPAMEVEVPDPGAAWGQMIMHVDEAGVMTWNFPRADDMSVNTTRGGSMRRYVIPRRVVPASSEGSSRGLIGAIGKKILKVLAFPIIDPIVGRVSELLAARWEAKKRPYRFRSFTPEDYSGVRARSLEDADWKRLSEGRSLLFVHGTFSQAHSGFGGFPADFVAELHKVYGGRVFAFDHFTLSDDPMTNIVWFINNIPDGTKLELDLVGHSRGGLVSRVLAENQSLLSLGARKIDVRSVVLVGTPNAGTALADSDHIGDFIDSYTNILNLFPTVGVADVLEGIITVAKQIAVGAAKGLEGLQCMVPGSEFLSELNAGARGAVRYYALTSDFEPVDAGFGLYFRDRLFDKIFGRAKNDLIVPTEGVFAANGSGYFPVEAFSFDATRGVQHSGFFANRDATQRILEALR